MPYHFDYEPGPGILNIKLSGLITGDDIREATSKAIACQKETGVTRFLVDLGRWEVGASIADIRELPAEQYSQEGLSRESRIAVIIPDATSSRYAANYYENECRKFGWNAQLFPDQASAHNWLLNAENGDARDTGNA